MKPNFQYYVHDEPDYFYVFVNVGPHRIGEMIVNKVDEARARLGNIEVKKKWKRARPWTERILSFNFSSHEFVNFQGKGIGSELLDRLRSWCSRNGVTEVFGSVTTDDLEKTPTLLEWYAERGFAAYPPSEECLEVSVAMVVWKALSDQESTARWGRRSNFPAWPYPPTSRELKRPSGLQRKQMTKHADPIALYSPQQVTKMLRLWGADIR